MSLANNIGSRYTQAPAVSPLLYDKLTYIPTHSCYASSLGSETLLSGVSLDLQ